MSNQYSTKQGSLMYDGSTNWHQNPDGTWSKAIPLPFYGLKKGCSCGKSFWKEENYFKHYRTEHTDGKRYKRTPTGMVELNRLLEEGDAHTNTIEGFWSQMKRSIDGTYHCVSPKHLQLYVNEFCYRYNLRNTLIFPVLVEQAALRVSEGDKIHA